MRSNRGNYRGRSPSRGKFGRGENIVFTRKCYHFFRTGHTMGKCLENNSSKIMERTTAFVQEDEVSSVTSAMGQVGPVQEGESMMLRRTLLKVP